MTFTRKLAIGALTTMLALSGLAGATNRSYAGSLSPGEAAAIAGVGGLIVGGLVVDSMHRNRPRHHVHSDYGWQQHVARCAARYRSYDPVSDTFLGYDGYRHYCRL